jgi:5-methylthioadenosine/S-adenosylhomocysteine deaminase
VDRPPIAGGALLVNQPGRIEAVGADAAVPRPSAAQAVEFADAVVLPGFVNAHTHLELHFLDGAAPEADFARWVRGMRRLRETTGGDTYRAAVRAGLEEVWSYGITTVADTGVSGLPAQLLAELGGRGIYYQEVFGPDPATADAAMAGLESALLPLRDRLPGSITLGVSPHAPYTVHPALLARVARWARERGFKLASHLAESRAEREFVSRRAGPFADQWRARGISLPPPARSPVAAWQDAGVLGADFLAIHAVELDGDDVAALARAGAAVALCPRSNARHGHGAARAGALLAAGLRVGLGTDSRASVPSLDLVAEARAARVLAGCSAVDAARLLTLGGAEALGLEQEVGSLAAGKWADFCVLRLGAPPMDPTRLAEAVLAAQRSAVLATYVAGRRVHPAGEEP